MDLYGTCGGGGGGGGGGDDGIYACMTVFQYTCMGHVVAAAAAVYIRLYDSISCFK